MCDDSLNVVNGAEMDERFTECLGFTVDVSSSEGRKESLKTNVFGVLWGTSAALALLLLKHCAFFCLDVILFDFLPSYFEH